MRRLRQTLTEAAYPALYAGRSLARAGMTAAGAPLRALPGSSANFGPPRRMIDSADQAPADSGIKALSLEPFPADTFAPPVCEPEILSERFERAREQPESRLTLYEIENGRLAGAEAAISQDDALIGDFSRPIGSAPRRNPIRHAWRLPSLRRISGSAFALVGPRADNYYHWMLQALPRLLALERAGVAPDKIITHGEKGFQRASLKALGLDEERLIFLEDAPHVQADTLLLSNEFTRSRIPREAAQWLRRAFDKLRVERKTGRRLFISRRDTTRRPLENETEIEALLKAHGFEPIAPGELSFAEQAAAFSSADCIVAQHGAALSNLVFCHEGATAIEIFSPKYINPCYFQLARAAGLRYGAVCGAGEIRGIAGKREIGIGSVRLDPQRLEAILGKLGITRESVFES